MFIISIEVDSVCVCAYIPVSGHIFGITCSLCNKQYMGQTKNALKTRILQHFTDIKSKKDTSVSKHFNHPSHAGRRDCTIHFLDFIHCSTEGNKAHTKLSANLRDEKEVLWIQRLKTLHPMGINIMDASFSTT